MIRWNKIGLIFNPKDTELQWMVHHAYSPVVTQMEGSIWRCYFAGRNTENRASIGYFDIDLKEPDKIKDVSKQPVLSIGPTGTFDCDGLIPSCVVKIDNAMYMYYSGWTRGWREPLFKTCVGLAISYDGGNTFEKYSTVPILDWSEEDPISVICPCVYKKENEYIMFYSSTDKWEEINGEYYSWYYNKIATSKDAIHWKREGKIALHKKKGENHIGRISVVETPNGYEGWYGYTTEDVGQYRIGYAISYDGKEWIRKDEETGMELSESGWDSEAQAYPYVIVWNGKRYMFYNGNRFGYDGIGLAIEEQR